MKATLAHIALLVRDYDEAIDFYTQVMDFDLIEDTTLSETKRWVRVRPKGGDGSSFLLAKAKNPIQEAAVGNQSGGRVFLFLHVTDFDSYFERLKTSKVSVLRGPIVEVYGKVAVIEDLYGNKWDIIEPK